MGKEKELVPIGEAAKLLGVSIMTLRRWDESGRFPAIRRREGGDRYYRRKDVEIFLNDLFKLARDWAIGAAADGGTLPRNFYCETSADFQARLARMQDDMVRGGVPLSLFPLLVSVAGEIGNNSFDHNLGQWPDVPGVFFGYDLGKRQVVLADRGVGVLHTLKRVRPGLADDVEALNVAFEEFISGRAPEWRGNGLKYVREVVAANKFGLIFQSGGAVLTMPHEEKEYGLAVTAVRDKMRGCLAQITYGSSRT